jgi:hypothetical protein
MSEKTDITAPKKGLSKYIPIPVVLKNKKEQSKYIKLLMKNKGKIYPAAKAYGISYQSVYNRMETDPDFRLAVREAQDLIRKEYAEKLEAVSEEEALDPKNVAERKTQMKAKMPEIYNPHKNWSSQITKINFTSTSIMIDDRGDPYAVTPEEAKANESEFENQEA